MPLGGYRYDLFQSFIPQF